MEIPFDICKGKFIPFILIRDDGLVFRVTIMWPNDGNVIVEDVFAVDIDFRGGI